MLLTDNEPCHILKNFIYENLSYVAKTKTQILAYFKASEGALMNILYSAKETPNMVEKTVPKYNPLFQLLLGCSGG